MRFKKDSKNKQKDEKSHQETQSSIKIGNFNDLVSLVWEPSTVVLPTVRKEESPIYRRKPQPSLQTDDSNSKERCKNFNPLRLQELNADSSDDSLFEVSNPYCPVHGDVRAINDVTVTLANPVTADGSANCLVSQSPPPYSPSLAQTVVPRSD